MERLCLCHSEREGGELAGLSGRHEAYFRCHVIRCAAEGVGRPVQVNLQLAHAEIGDANVAFVIQQNVVQFQVSAVGSSTISSNLSAADWRGDGVVADRTHSIVWLPVHDAFLVEEFQSGDDFSGVETSPVLLEAATLLDVEHQVTTV